MRATFWPSLPTHLRPEGITKTLSNIGGDFLILSTCPYSTNSHPLLLPAPPPRIFQEPQPRG